jgi:hypothetical protein
MILQVVPPSDDRLDVLVVGGGVEAAVVDIESETGRKQSMRLFRCDETGLLMDVYFVGGLFFLLWWRESLEFHRIREAYAVVSDPTLRPLYNKYLASSICVPFKVWRTLSPSLQAVSDDELVSARVTSVPRPTCTSTN